MGEIKWNEWGVREFLDDFWSDVATKELREFKKRKRHEQERAWTQIEANYHPLEPSFQVLVDEIDDATAFEIWAFQFELTATLGELATPEEIRAGLADREVTIRREQRDDEHEMSKLLAELYIEIDEKTDQAENLRTEYYMCHPTYAYLFRDFSVFIDARENFWTLLHQDQDRECLEREQFERETIQIAERMMAPDFDEHYTAQQYVDWSE